MSEEVLRHGDLKLLTFQSDDVAEFAELLADPELRASLYPDLKRPPSLELVMAQWIGLPQGRNDAQFTVHLSGREVIGGVRIESRIISYFIGSKYRGIGHGKMAVRLAIRGVTDSRDVGFLQAFVDRDNSASRRILEGSGFIFSGFSGGPASVRRLLSYTYRAGTAHSHQLASTRVVATEHRHDCVAEP